MPPAPSDSPVGRARGPVGAARRLRAVRGPGSGPPQAGPNADGSRPRAADEALASLLVDLGSRVRRGTSQEVLEAPRALATGLAELDQRLGGGFPQGRLSEICGAPSSGRTSLVLRLLAETLGRERRLGAWVDLADAFDPASAEAGGVPLERLLWVRPRRVEEAVRSSERLLRTQGFGLIVLDGAGPAESRLRDVTWLRLARLAASTRTALLAVTAKPSTGSRAEVVLEMAPRGARFTGSPGLLESLETTAILRRHRSRPIGAPVSLSIPLSPPPPPCGCETPSSPPPPCGCETVTQRP